MHVVDRPEAQPVGRLERTAGLCGGESAGQQDKGKTQAWLVHSQLLGGAKRVDVTARAAREFSLSLHQDGKSGNAC